VLTQQLQEPTTTTTITITMRYIVRNSDDVTCCSNDGGSNLLFDLSHPHSLAPVGFSNITDMPTESFAHIGPASPKSVQRSVETTYLALPRVF
jgi:hypothetical protein